VSYIGHIYLHCLPILCACDWLIVVKVVKVFILPMLRAEADRLQSVLEGPLGNNTDRIAADHVKVALMVSRRRHLSVVLSLFRCFRCAT